MAQDRRPFDAPDDRDAPKHRRGGTLHAHALRVTATLVAGLWPGRDALQVARRIEALTPRGQVGVIGGVLGMMFLCSLFAAQFGLLGMALFFMAVFVIVA